jgi:lysyl endopeptidase
LTITTTRCIVTIALLVLSGQLIAQIIKEGTPLSWNLQEPLVNTSIWQELPDIDLEAISQEDAVEDTAKSIPYRFAYATEVNWSSDNLGRWSNLHNGDRLWVMGVDAPGALCLGMSLSELFLPEGARLYVYNEDHTDFVGPITSKDNRANQLLSIPPIQGDRVILEYYEPFAFRGQGSFNINYVTYGYRNLIEPLERPENDCLVLNNDSEVGRKQDISSSIVMMLVDKGQRIATGTLLNNTSYDATPYVLTAIPAVIGNVGGFVFLFGTNVSSGTITWSHAISGAQLEESNGGTALLKLRDNPGRDWAAFYSGWDISETNQSGTFTCIQSALGLELSVSQFEGTFTNSSFGNIETSRIDNWLIGNTFKGSIGSPLFDTDDNLVGVYVGGTSTCEDNTNDHFALLSNSWLKYGLYLDPYESASARLSGLYAKTESEERNDGMEVSFFPNPASDWIYIRNKSEDPIKSIEIFDSAGRIIHSYSSLLLATLDISDLPVGIYVIRFVGNTSSRSASLFVK